MLKKLEARDKRRGRDADVDWLVTQQAEALHILAGVVLFAHFKSSRRFCKGRACSEMEWLGSTFHVMAIVYLVCFL